jgi:predicted RNA-binding Zn-ribbon protein involved in translation (DUF1610 family)
MMSDSWYARRLGRQPQQQAPVQQRVMPQQQQQYHNPYQTYPGQQQLPQQPPPPGSVTHENFMQMAAQWHGGPAMKADPYNCPECGSPRFYSRAKTVSRGPAPAPHCFDCGYSGGLFSQGEATTWGATG